MDTRAGSGSTLEMTRTFRAPRALVWKAWTDPDQLLKWFGPRHHPATKAEGDFRVGGTYRRCLVPAEGGDLWLTGEYLEIVELERLVFTFQWDGSQDTRPNVMRVTLTFEDEGANTKMTLRQTGLLDDEQRDGHDEGWTSSLDRLDDFLAGRSL